MVVSHSKKLEQKVLLSLLKKDFNAVKKLLHENEKFDWSYIYDVAEDHNMIPVLYKYIQKGCVDLIAPGILEKFKNHYRSVAAFNFARSTQLIKLVQTLEKKNLSVIAYKGMALAEFAYNDTTLRQFGDIDLFIKKKDFPEVKQTLLESKCESAWNLDEAQEKAVLKYYYEYPFYYGENQTLIEVHWEFVEPFFSFKYEIDEIWDRTETVNLYGTDITTLSAEDYLVVLTSHGSKHFWKRLSWICDIAALIENKDIDWSVVEKRASKYSSFRMVLLGVYLAKTFFATEVPDHILSKIMNEKGVKLLGNEVMEKVFDRVREPNDWKQMALRHLKMRENIGTKIAYSYRLFTTKAIDSLFLPMGRPR